MVLAGIGLVDALYLSWVKLANAYALCGPIGDCETVNSSPYAEIAGIPVALLGAGAYLAILVSLILERRAGAWGEFVPLLVFGLSLTGVLYSAYLTYLEVAVIRAICPYCLVSAVDLGLLLVMASLRLAKAQGAQRAVPE